MGRRFLYLVLSTGFFQNNIKQRQSSRVINRIFFCPWTGRHLCFSRINFRFHSNIVNKY